MNEYITDWWPCINKAAVLYLSWVTPCGWHVRLQKRRAERGQQDNGIRGDPRATQGTSDRGHLSIQRIGKWDDISASPFYLREHFHFLSTRTVDTHMDTHRHFLSLCVCPEGTKHIHIQWMIGRGRSRSEPFCFPSRWQKEVAITTLWWIQGSFPTVFVFHACSQN